MRAAALAALISVTAAAVCRPGFAFINSACVACGDGSEPSPLLDRCVPCGVDSAGTLGRCHRCTVGTAPNSGHSACVEEGDYFYRLGLDSWHAILGMLGLVASCLILSGDKLKDWCQQWATADYLTLDEEELEHGRRKPFDGIFGSSDSAAAKAAAAAGASCMAHAVPMAELRPSSAAASSSSSHSRAASVAAGELAPPFPAALRPSACFTGQEGNLAALAAGFFPKAATQSISSSPNHGDAGGDGDFPEGLITQAISGLGGAGKTQLAAQYAHRLRRRYPAGIFFVSVDMGSASAATGSDWRHELLRRLARALQLFDAEVEAGSDQLQAVTHAWLARHVGWLLILDNADDADALHHAAMACVPPVTASGHVLFTSRLGSLAIESAGVSSPLQISILPLREAQLLLVRESSAAVSTVEDATARLADLSDLELAALIWLVGPSGLGGLPLALVQAGRYMRYKCKGFASYKREFEHRLLRQLMGRAPVDHRSEHESQSTPRGVFSTWDLNFEQLASETQAGPAAMEVLWLCSLCAADDIPVWLLARVPSTGVADVCPALAQWIHGDRGGGSGGGDGEAEAAKATALDELVNAAHKYSLLEPSLAPIEGGESPSFTRPVEVRRTTVSMHRLVQRALRARAAARTDRAFNFLGSLLADALPFTGELLGDSWSGNMSVKQKLSAAAELMPHAEELMRQQQGLSPSFKRGQQGPTVLPAKLYRRVGVTHERRGAFTVALQALEGALAIDEATHGAEHPAVAATFTMMGNVLARQGRYSDAMARYERALAIKEATHGTEHMEVANTLTNMGTVLARQGRYSYADAMARYERALAIKEVAYGKEHLEVGVALSNMANVLARQGRYADAISRYERALAIDEATYGKDHLEVAITLTNMGTVLARQGRYADAIARYERALAIDEATHGKEHPQVAQTSQALARVRRLHENTLLNHQPSQHHETEA